jgi:ribose transport system permease protein
MSAPPTKPTPAFSAFFASTLSGPVLGLLAVASLFILLIGIKGELHHLLSLRNLQVLVHENTITAVVVLGALMVMISGGIDLSVGSVVALVTVVAMRVYLDFYERHASTALASWAAIGAGVGAGGLCGLANGLIITRLGVPPFVATLGMLSIARGLAVWLADRQVLAFKGPDPEWVEVFNQVHPPYTIFNPGFWSLVLAAAVVACLLKFTVVGRYIYAIGANERAASLCGVPIRRSKIFVYVLAGLLTGWAGILRFAVGTSGDPKAAEGLELEVIAAVVVGGASLTGGRGTVFGALLGVLILGVLANGVNVFNVPVEIQYILIGAIIIANTALAKWRGESAEMKR